MLNVFIVIKREIHKLLNHLWIIVDLNYCGLNVTVSIFDKVFEFKMCSIKLQPHSFSITWRC